MYMQIKLARVAVQDIIMHAMHVICNKQILAESRSAADDIIM